MIRISNVKMGLDKVVNSDTEKQALESIILSKLKISKKELGSFKIFKKSIDARKKNKIIFVYTVDVNLHYEESILRKYGSKEITQTPDLSYKWGGLGTEDMTHRPVVIGLGPAGLFAGLILAKKGYNPIILERGEDVDNRTSKINKFWKQHQLDIESNVQFGEGGAGTFSDGKLTTQINDKRCRMILEEFIEMGAPEKILYESKPHIGTDILKSVVKNIREEIIAHGGEVRFTAKVTDLIIKDGNIDALIINDNEKLSCQVVLLAIGHSARDTFEMLHNKGMVMTQKPFSIGVRIEHPQDMLDKAQYGEFAKHPGLGAADYKLSYHSKKNGRSAYTFCMCPGGYVVAAASEERGIVTNGMSEYKRDGANANSALLVGVKPSDFQSDHPLAGIDFQRKWEGLAFKIGGENYRAPAQLTGDFLANRPSNKWGSVQPTYKPGVTFAQLKDCLPDYVIETLKEAIMHFNTKIKGFAMPDSILTGVETRSSSPIRINRDEDYLSNIGGIYPVGEGAGYAGGIMSSAVDGFKIAEKIMEKYAPLKQK
ncbi:NAD(P)/FAD-dependent oxidoreductase [Irregularibacter muris]|uniref:NAD(P)/FAD-dependent oxidoreductase n=1 Tax=Irregularibacter muris TaxID=1796619 RepID=A0AAE3HFW6_9FIRM|nr:NAD(P)/FAD-dependent oxidoreductase [Irregularibacter muris]MCR1899832.1 NAD(P)/FAD-dependent oxidoreductase [Irregularibacter muris]